MHIIKAYKDVKGKLVPDKLNSEDTNAFNMLMLQGSLMNDNSFGYFTPTHVERVADKYESRAYPKIVDAPFVIGHNRFATKGKSTKKNAHPFQSSRFTWVHNGIIDNDVSLRKKFKLKIKSPVDSAIIGHLVEHFAKKNTIEESIKKAIEKIAGDYSIFLYDKLTDRLFYFRNNLRTLETSLLKLNKNRYILIGSTDGDNLKLAYTKRMLNFDMTNAIVLAKQKIESDTIFEVNGNGFESIEQFKPLARTYPNYTSNYYFNQDLNEYTEANAFGEDDFELLNPEVVESLRKSIERMGFDINITKKENNSGITGVFVYGKDIDEFKETYPEYFSAVYSGVMTSMNVLDFLDAYDEQYAEA